MKRLIGIALIIILLLLLRSAIVSIIEVHGSKSRLISLRNSLDEKKSENKFLKERLKYVETNAFIESEARNKLGLVREDEYVIIAPPPQTDTFDEEKHDERPNWRKWLSLFL